MGKVSKRYETNYGYYRIEVEDACVTAIRKEPEEKSKTLQDTRINVNVPQVYEDQVGGDCDLHTTEGEAEDIQVMEAAYQQLCEYLQGDRRAFDLQMNPKGTAFQKKVWQALCDIPYGETRSYKDIAVAVGSPNACRAVGTANHVNPIIIAVP